MEIQQITSIHRNIQSVCANQRSGRTNIDLTQLTQHFSIYQISIALAFMKGFNFRKTAKAIGVSLCQFYDQYLSMLNMAGTTNKKELTKICRKVPMFSDLHYKNGRLKNGTLNFDEN